MYFPLVVSKIFYGRRYRKASFGNLLRFPLDFSKCFFRTIPKLSLDDSRGFQRCFPNIEKKKNIAQAFRRRFQRFHLDVSKGLFLTFGKALLLARFKRLFQAVSRGFLVVSNQFLRTFQEVLLSRFQRLFLNVSSDSLLTFLWISSDFTFCFLAFK